MVAGEMQLRSNVLYGVLEERQLLLRRGLWDSIVFSRLNELSRGEKLSLILPRYEIVVDICWHRASQQGVSAPTKAYATFDDTAFPSG
jgi:hypothetical protein